MSLRARHHRCDPEAESPGFSILELLIVMAIVAVIAAIGVPQFLSAADRARQRGTMADMHNIAKANAPMRLDTGSYASALSDLESQGYMNEVPDTDDWGNAWKYKLKPGKDSYELKSQGSDKKQGPKPPTPWLNEPYTSDLILVDGMFTQAPTSI